MRNLVQLHTRVRKETKEVIRQIAKDNRCEMGAVIDAAVQGWIGDIGTSEQSGATEPPPEKGTRRKKPSQRKREQKQPQSATD